MRDQATDPCIVDQNVQSPGDGGSLGNKPGSIFFLREVSLNVGRETKFLSKRSPFFRGPS